MTVRRSQSEMFDTPLPEVLKTIRAILANGQADYRYENTVESDGGREMSTTLKPTQPGILTTKLGIHLYPFETQTKVLVETKSQWFLFGDVAGFYGNYIRDLLHAIRSGIGREVVPAPINNPIPSKAPMRLFITANFVCAFLMLTQTYLIRFFLAVLAPSGTPEPIERTLLRVHIQIIFGIAIVLFLLGFNFWWRKKYFQALDPRVQASMDYGRNIGRRMAVVIGIVGVVFLALRYFVKP